VAMRRLAPSHRLLPLTAVALLVLIAQAAWTQDGPRVLARGMANGREIVGIRVGPGLPPPVLPASVRTPTPNPAAGTNTLANVPAYDWCYGCSATSAAMMMGYYDQSSHPNMYAGPANGGVCPLDNSAAWAAGESPLSATHLGYDGLAVKGHADDYWVSYLSAAADPYITGAWTQHTWADCTGDYMGTNQSAWHNTDGSTTFFYYTSWGGPLYDYTGHEPSAVKDGAHGMRAFVQARGYTVAANRVFNQLVYPNPIKSNTFGFTFDDYKNEIDKGRPVLIQVEGHTMLGVGYNDPDTVYLHDT